MTKPDWYRRTEGKLYAYPSIPSAIAHLEAQVQLLSCNMAPPKAAVYDRIGPPSTGEKLTEPERFADTRIEKIGKKEAQIALKRAEKAAIEAAMRRLGEEERELVEKWYFQGWKLKHPEKKIWRELRISWPTFFNRRKKIVEKMAEWLGEKTRESCQAEL
ncbi:MAG: hypothetical protein A4E52_01830 [Pelotomaculum sp. PtaB.Bin013]|nr:MAG: hypothetical protein A4E52_01830 [Pelotomaculum sp. PtaB.Bin013]